MQPATEVQDDSFVALLYTLFDQDGHVIDRIERADPVTYVHGYGQILPGLERALGGLSTGQTRSVVVEPKDGYGGRDDEAVFEVDKSEFPHPDKIAQGDEFIAESPEGELVLRVLEVGKDSVKVDGNHPLAGKTLRFEVEIIEVRSATDEEIDEAESALREWQEHDGEHGHEGHVHHDGCSHEPLVSLGVKRGHGVA